MTICMSLNKLIKMRNNDSGTSLMQNRKYYKMNKNFMKTKKNLNMNYKNTTKNHYTIHLHLMKMKYSRK